MVMTTATWTYADLEEMLQQEEWQAADDITLSLLLEATNRTGEGWLDTAAIARIPCATLHQLDHLWYTTSQGRFGFSAQFQVYASVGYDTFQFSQEVGWLLLPVRPLGFYKFYDFLHFKDDAPQGHLPAYWYWKVAWDHSVIKGGFGTGRGAGFGDPDMFDAMMLRLDRCSLV